MKINKYLIVSNFIDGEENDYHPIGRRQSSLHSTPKTPPNVVPKKKPGLLKGIGSMFRLDIVKYLFFLSISIIIKI